MNIKEQMESLPKLIGKTVEIEYVSYGNVRRKRGELREVGPYSNIVTGYSGVPFIGYGSAIRRISVDIDGIDEVAFLNPHIPVDYDIRNDDEARDSLVALSFGQDIADGQKEARVSYSKAWEARMEEANAATIAKAPAIIESGAALVKSDLVDEWREYARNNSTDGYSGAVVEATVQALQVLADGKTPGEAESAAVAAETSFQMGCVAKGLSYFAPRGDEFRAYWNRKFVSEEKATEADVSGGVVNPAVLTVG